MTLADCKEKGDFIPTTDPNNFNWAEIYQRSVEQRYEDLLPIIEKLNRDTYFVYSEESYPRVADNPAIVPILEQIADIEV